MRGEVGALEAKQNSSRRSSPSSRLGKDGIPGQVPHSAAISLLSLRAQTITIAITLQLLYHTPRSHWCAALITVATRTDVAVATRGNQGTDNPKLTTCGGLQQRRMRTLRRIAASQHTNARIARFAAAELSQSFQTPSVRKTTLFLLLAASARSQSRATHASVPPWGVRPCGEPLSVFRCNHGGADRSGCDGHSGLTAMVVGVGGWVSRW